MRTLLTLCLAAAAAANVTAQNLLQLQAVNGLPMLPLGPSSGYVAAGDLDGDGDTDLAACEANNAVLYWKQGGSYARVARTTYNFESIVAVADFDGDGFTDVVFGPFSDIHSSVLWFWWGDGSGSFASAATYEQTIHNDFMPGQVFPSDVDQDGDVDLVMWAPATSMMAYNCVLLRNLGNRTFARAPTSEFPGVFCGDGRPRFLDVDGDGWQDLVMASRNNTSRLFWNNGGNFAMATASEFPLLTQSLQGAAVGDFDRDGDLDLALGGGDGPGVLLVAQAPRQLQVAAGATGLPDRTVLLWPVDVDGDGDLDLYAFRQEFGQLLLNVGTGAFAMDGTFGSCDDTERVVEADFDDDGDVDLLRIGSVDGQATPPIRRLAVSYALPNGRLQDAGDSRLPPSIVLGGPQRGDIDGDGLDDLWLSIRESSTWTYTQFARNDGRGVYGYDRALRNGVFSPGFFADLDQDGCDEFVLPGISTGYFANHQGRLDTAPTPLPISGQMNSGAALDLDGDGDLDLVLTEEYGQLSRVRVIVNQGSAWQEETATRLNAPSIPGSRSTLHGLAADLDGDGDQDVVIGTQEFTMLLQNQGGVLTFVPNAIPIGTSYLGYQAHAGDLDGDGDLDLHLGRTVFLNDGTGMFTEVTNRVPAVLGLETLSDVIDIDDDGDLDLVGQSAVVWNDGTAHFTLANNVVPVSGGSIACFLWTDADRDGDADLFASSFIGREYGFYTNMLRQLWLDAPSRLGGVLALRYHEQPGQSPTPVAMFLFGSFGRIAATPVPGFGWLQIDPSQAFLIGSAFLPAAGGDATLSVPLPRLPALQGMYLCAQALDVRGSRFRLGNLVETWLDN